MDLDEVKLFFKDKSVILVGNSVELMNHDYAEFIDSYDIVVRFGKAIESSKTERMSIGSKLDVWLTGEFRSRMAIKEPYRSMLRDKLILFNRSRMHMTRPLYKIKQMSKSFDMYSDDEILEIYKEYNITDSDPDARRFSAGLWAIKFFCEKIKTQKSVTLIGFDFFKKYTSNRRGGNADPCSWHRPMAAGNKETHWHEQEVDIVNLLKDQGLLTWIIISNLDSEEISNTKYGKF